MRPHPYLIFVLILLVLQACGGTSSDDKIVTKKANIFSLRNQARLHGQRESEEGYIASAALLDQILQIEPNDVRALMDRLRCAVQIESEWKNTQDLVDRLKKLQIPTSQETAFDYLQGIASKRAQDHTMAWQSFERVLAKDPTHKIAHYQAGLAAEKGSKLEAARAHFQYLLDKKQLIRPAAYRLSQVYRGLAQKEKMNQAIKLFQSRPNDEKPVTEFCAFLKPSQAPFVANERDSAADPLKFSMNKSPISSAREVSATKGQLAWSQGDINNDGRQDLISLGPTGVSFVDQFESNNNGPQQLEVKGWTDLVASSKTMLLDSDHDGDLDVLFMAAKEKTGSELVQLRNLGEKGFELQAMAGFVHPLSPQLFGMAANDFDSGNDIDLVLPGSGSALTILMNLRDDKWQRFELPGGARQIAVAADFNGDGLPDVIGVGSQPGASLFLNKNTEHTRGQAIFGKEKILAPESGTWAGIAAEDLDNDGDLDCVLWGPGFCVLRNRGAGTFDTEIQPEARDLSITRLEIRDNDGDGILAIEFVDGPKKSAYTWTPKLPDGKNAVALLPDGRKDNRDGIGAIVEVFAGEIHTTRMVTRPGPMHFGIGDEELDGFAIRWPQGIRQTVVGDTLAACRDKNQIKVKQKQGLVASCPFLFTKTTTGWKFKTDIVGIAPLDEWLPNGELPHLDPEEFVRLGQDELAIVNGGVRLAITEELREITYLDRVELYYLDIDPEATVLTDESTRQEVYGALQYFTTSPQAITRPRSVVMNGHDVTDLVSQVDRLYLHGYRTGPSQLQGWGPQQDVEIVLARNARAMVLWGRLAWYDSSTSYAMAQAGLTWVLPRVEILADSGSWQTLLPDLGFPAGMDRSLLLRFPQELAAGTRIRIVSNQRFLWDRIALLEDLEAHTIPVQANDPVGFPGLMQGTLVEAQLRDRGYSSISGNRELHEQDYSWQAEPRDDFPRPFGRATAYGDVKKHLDYHDDDFCILVAADALEMEFTVAPIPEGRQRVWFLRVTGWAKESSFHNRLGRDILPLPTKSMNQYPPTLKGSNASSSAERHTRWVGH